MDCKYYQEQIGEFEGGKLTIRQETEFVNHIKECAGCRDEMEMYYIMQYGIDDADDIDMEKRFRIYFDDYDFEGLVDEKLKASTEKCNNILKWAHINQSRFTLVAMIMVFTALILTIIELF